MNEEKRKKRRKKRRAKRPESVKLIRRSSGNDPGEIKSASRLAREKQLIRRGAALAVIILAIAALVTVIVTDPFHRDKVIKEGQPAINESQIY